MRKILLIFSLMVSTLLGFAQAKVVSGASSTKPLVNKTDSVSVAFGTMLGTMLAPSVGQALQNGVEAFDYDLMCQAIANVLKGQPTGMTEVEADHYLSTVMGLEQENQSFTPQSQKEFLQEMAAKEGTITTPSGVILEIVREGEGETPSYDSEVLLNYQGKLYDGTVFDDSYNRGPVVLEVNRLIPGFSEALQLMKPGGHYRAYIPSDLGYGPSGIPGVIPGNAALQFDVELY